MMHVDIEPRSLELSPGESGGVTVRITNASTVIDAFRVTVFGLDPEWVDTPTPRLSLFPSESGIVEVIISLPDNFPAGYRELSIHVQSANDAGDFALAQLSLSVVAQPRLTLRMDPVMVTGGSEAAFGMVVANHGNTTVFTTADGIDPEAKAEIEFLPTSVDLPPGHQDVIQATVRARRPWFGQPKVRMLTFGVDAHTRTETVATFLQKPRISRGLLSLLGLLTAAAVFAAVLSRTFENVVDEATIDEQVLSEALDQNAQGGNPVPVDPGGIAGTVILATTKEPVAGVQAELFRSDDVKVPIATAATSDQGAFSFGSLAAGDYKIRFHGAGFSEIWFPSATTAADAGEIAVELGNATVLDPVTLGGRPGSIAGVVEADEPTGAVATLFVPGAIEVPGVPPDEAEAAVQSVDVAADGTFLFEQVPSPARYQLVVRKPGYATETREVELGPAQAIEGIEIVLRKGDGTISGLVTGNTGSGAPFALGGATIEASDGTTTISTVSLTEDAVGTYTVRGLPTPGVYTLTISRPDYRTETRTVSVDTAADVTGIDAQLQRATGSLSGAVTLQGEGALGGVTVSIAGGDTAITTISATTGSVGSWFVDGLPLPATYTITFSREGYVSQTLLRDIDPSRGSVDVSEVNVAMVRQNATVRGVVRDVTGQPVARASIVLTNGTITRTLITADDPLGQFEFSNVLPGAYTLTASRTGSTAAVLLVNVSASEVRELDIPLLAQASLTGQVLRLSSANNAYVPYVNATVRLFLPSKFPGSANDALATMQTDGNGNYTFTDLEAPLEYVIAVFANSLSPEPLDSRLVLTQPSTQVTVPPFQISEVS